MECYHVNSREEHKIVCVAAHKLEKVQEFSSEHSVDKAYGNIEDLAEDADVEVVFIAVITSRHFKITKMMLNHGVQARLHLLRVVNAATRMRPFFSQASMSFANHP